MSGAWSWSGDGAGEEPSISRRETQLWVDVWIPTATTRCGATTSPAAAEWVGAWWLDVLDGFGLSGFDVHTGRSVPG